MIQQRNDPSGHRSSACVAVCQLIEQRQAFYVNPICLILKTKHYILYNRKCLHQIRYGLVARISRSQTVVSCIQQPGPRRPGFNSPCRKFYFYTSLTLFLRLAKDFFFAALEESWSRGGRCCGAFSAERSGRRAGLALVPISRTASISLSAEKLSACILNN